MYTVPVLFIIFNRPEITKKALSAIRQVRPRYLYVAADGPRPDCPEDIKKCMETRDLIEEVDWDCEVKTLFREENRGCGRGPAEAITWFFKEVEQGIIIEDDCIAHVDFFLLCSELLMKYKNHEQIYTISASNPLLQWKKSQHSYFFCRSGSMFGGWATWRRAWRTYKHDISDWKEPEKLLALKQKIPNAKAFTSMIYHLSIYGSTDRQMDVWDHQWFYARIMNDALSIVPSVNLMSNIGFGEGATHTTNPNDRLSNQKQFYLSWPLKHAPTVVDELYDWLVFEMFVSPESKRLTKRIILKLIKIFYRIKV